MAKSDLEKYIRWRHYYAREAIEMGNCVNCKSLDNRFRFYINRMLRELKPPFDVYGCTVQEEEGIHRLM